MKYSVLLSDADGTLFNFHAGEKNAIEETFRHYGIPYDEAHIAAYHSANQAQWKLLELGKTTQARLKVDRVANFLANVGIKLDAVSVSEYLVNALSRQQILLPGAEAFCKAVSAHMPIWLVTNGIAKVQRGRFTNCPLSPYVTGMVISEEVGSAKPHPEMVYEALKLAGCKNKQDAVLFGDSVTADIAAARAAGVDSILYTNGQEPPDGHGATYVARTYQDALSLLGIA